MSQPVALVTGAGGEMGHLLIPALRQKGYAVVALDLVALPDSIREQCVEAVEASILDKEVLSDLFQRHSPDAVYHLAAVLSRKAEADPDLAHRVNVEGSYNLLQLCHQPYRTEPVRLLFPSSIAVYGLPNGQTKNEAGAIKEHEWTVPAGVYGCNKLYCELLGRYYAKHYKQMAADSFVLDHRRGAVLVPAENPSRQGDARLLRDRVQQGEEDRRQVRVRAPAEHQLDLVARVRPCPPSPSPSPS